jgi:membrane protein YdbS with pleckstrin-like domain
MAQPDPARPMRFKSKVDSWLVAVVIVTGMAALAAGAVVLREGAPGGLLTMLLLVALVVALPIWLLAATDYAFEQTALRIRSGPFRWTIRLDEIRSVQPTRNPLSSPALSLDRLRITYGGGKFIMISPEDKAGFLQELRKRCPGVTFADSGSRAP